MHKPDLVIFDCDGVLVDSERIGNQVIQTDLALHGLAMTLDEVMSFFIGGTMRDVMLNARAMGAELPDDWVADIYEKMFEALARECAPIAGVSTVLDALEAARIPYWIASNGPHRKMQVTLTKTGLMERVTGRIVSREDVAHPKPAPDVYLYAAAQAGVAPERAVVIEDSGTGAKAGKAAGMVTYGYAAETPAENLMPICDAVFYEMAALPALLGIPAA